MLTAVIQVQALILAQVSQAVQHRVREAAREVVEPRPEVPEHEEEWPEEEEADGEESMMMQRSMMVASPEDGVGTFGFWLQKLSEVVSEMDERTRRVCMDFMRGYLATRYGTTPAGRSCVGERARGLEAPVIAFAGDPATNNDICERRQDLDWRRRWWTKLLPALRMEEHIIQQTCNTACDNGGQEADTVQSSQAPTEAVTTQPDMDIAEQERELERQVLEEDAYQWQRELDEQVKEHDALVEEEARADEERYARYQADKKAQRAQEWEDWSMYAELNPEGSAVLKEGTRKRTYLRMMIQQRNVESVVARQETFQMPLEGGGTVTMGFQVTSPDVTSSTAGSSHGLPPEGAPPRREQLSTGPVNSSASSTEEYQVQPVSGSDLSEFLSSIPGIHLYNKWSLGAISSASVLQRRGRGVLEAFEAQKVFLDSQAAEGDT